ncbi:hypothetical protein PANDA_020164 [Ailuropoda melanoleuca]|uniref:Tumor necrosis factor receptor superfamily member 18 n=1 Tax=Ailuropoda melanoleuca TaxID=9646 RepID=D2I3Q0_AILME|nr:hypothetical protein PANDA_020164 [Ailuropoda melanoleuca]
MEARGARVALCGVTLLCACKTCKHHTCPPGQEVRPHDPPGTSTQLRVTAFGSPPVCLPPDACPGMGHTWALIFAKVPVLQASETSVQWKGNFNFGFECVDCATGTFSGGQEGRCKPWSDCSQFGYPTMFPGNKTHNAVCSLGLPLAKPHDLLTIVLLTVAACILVLTAAQLALHIWQLRRQRAWLPETQLLLEARPAAEDACSCQFPEEERGEQRSEDKGQPRDLWV